MKEKRRNMDKSINSWFKFNRVYVPSIDPQTLEPPVSKANPNQMKSLNEQAITDSMMFSPKDRPLLIHSSQASRGHRRLVKSMQGAELKEAAKTRYLNDDLVHIGDNLNSSIDVKHIKELSLQTLKDDSKIQQPKIMNSKFQKIDLKPNLNIGKPESQSKFESIIKKQQNQRYKNIIQKQREQAREEEAVDYVKDNIKSQGFSKNWT